MISLYQQLIAILSRYMSGVNAHSVLGRAVRQADLNPENLQPRDIETLKPTLDRGIRLFVDPARQVQLRYRQSVLGLAWTVVQPVAIMAIYGFIFTRILDVSGEGIPYLSMAWSGLTVWMYVQATVQVVEEDELRPGRAEEDRQ